MKTIIQKLLARRPQVSPLGDPPPVAPTLTVGRIHDILDAARSGDISGLFTLYRDMLMSSAHLQAEFAKRKLAVLGDECVVQAASDNEHDVTTANALRHVLTAKGFLQACVHLLDSVLWPVAVVEKIFEIDTTGALQYRVAELRPVPHTLLDYREGYLRIRDVDSDGKIAQTTHDPDPDRYIIHRGHMLSVPDIHGGPMRAILFWYLFSVLGRDWWVRFLDRLGAPIVIGKYPAGDDESRRVVKQAISQVTKTFGLAVTDSTEIEMIQAGTQSGENFERFLALAHREMSKLILGQTLSAEAQPTGLNSGVATIQGEVRKDIRRLDAMRLADTLREQLLDQLVRINGLPGSTPIIRWIEDTDDDVERFVKTLGDIRKAGLELTDEAIAIASRRTGLQLKRSSGAGADTPFFG